MAYASIQLMKLNTTNVTAQTTVVIPAAHSILQIAVHNTTGNAVTGGIKIGTTVGGVDVVLALPVAANALFVISDTEILKKIFNMADETTLYIDAVTLFNSASLNFHFALRKVI